MKKLFFCVAVAALAAATPGYAASAGGCDSFEWPLKVERELLTAADVDATESGANKTEPPSKAVDLRLAPSSAANLPVTPSGKPKSATGETYGGFVVFAGAAQPGLYQVTLSAPSWIDVVQNGATLAAVAHTGKSDCEGVRKSVRFDIGAGPFTVMVSGATAPAIRFTVTPAK